MIDIEHPTIDKVNRHGYLNTADRENTINICACCDAPLKRGVTIVEFQDQLFCDNDCLTEAFSENPKLFGAETTELN